MADQPRAHTLRNLAEIIAFVAVVVADAFGLVPITQTMFLIPLIWILLRFRNDRWSTIGFYRPDNLRRSIALGVLYGVLMELFAVYVSTPQISAIFGVEPDYSDSKIFKGKVCCCPLSSLAGATRNKECLVGFKKA